jgi:hypothetical protein
MRTASGSPADRPRTDDRSAGRRGSIRNGGPVVVTEDRSWSIALRARQTRECAANRPGAEREPDLGQLRGGLNGGSERIGSGGRDRLAGAGPGRRSRRLCRLAKPRGLRSGARGARGDSRSWGRWWLGRRCDAGGGCARVAGARGALLAAAVRPRTRQRAEHVRGMFAGHRVAMIAHRPAGRDQAGRAIRRIAQFGRRNLKRSAQFYVVMVRHRMPRAWHRTRSGPLFGSRVPSVAD